MRLRNYYPKKLAWPILGISLASSWLIEIWASHFAQWHISFYLLGLWITYPALHFSFGTGLIMSFIMGLWLDINTPLPLGTQAIIGSLAYILLQFTRQNIRKMGDLPFTLSACIINSVCLILLAFWLKNSDQDTIDYWQNISLVGIFSILIIICISPVWIATLTLFLKKRLLNP